jgi:hypothetical protein
MLCRGTGKPLLMGQFFFAGHSAGVDSRFAEADDGSHEISLGWGGGRPEGVRSRFLGHRGTKSQSCG